MARVSVEQEALTDSRFGILGRLLGCPEPFAADFALGRMVRIWHECILRGQYSLERQIVDAILGTEGASEMLVRSQLGALRNDRVRVKGTRGRIEYLDKLRQGNRLRKQRSRMRHAEVTRDTPGALALALTPALALGSVVVSETEVVSDTECAEPSADGRSTPNPGPEFPVVGKGPGIWSPSQELRDDLASAFPSLDLAAQLDKARVWCVVNTDRRKTARGMAKFLFGWMERAQNNGRAAAPHPRLSAKGEATAQAARNWLERAGKEDSA